MFSFLSRVETISPSSVAAPSEGKSGIVVTVSASALDCYWNVQANTLPWILISSPNSQKGDGTLTFAVGPNTGGSRTGTINIANQTLLINQVPPGKSVDTIPAVNTSWQHRSNLWEQFYRWFVRFMGFGDSGWSDSALPEVGADEWQAERVWVSRV
jgi:hypothetical protein